MKKILIALIILFATAAHAEMQPGPDKMESTGQGQMPMMQKGPMGQTSQMPMQMGQMGQGSQMPMMQMGGMPMMQNMMAQQATVQNILQMLMEMSRIQESMVGKTPAPAEKKRMTEELRQMQERISTLMVSPATGAQKACSPGAGCDGKMQCKKYIEEAMRIQSDKLANPEKTTPAMENELMQKLKSANDCCQKCCQGPRPAGPPPAKLQPGHEAHH